MLAAAFKEWAAVCHALADGRQTVILRKGGIHESGGVFRPEHNRFWLLPTHFHAQQQAGLKPTARDLLAAADAARPPAGEYCLAHLADVVAVHHLDTLAAARSLDALHVWSPETVEQRFHYRRPGLYLLVVRVFALPDPVTVPEQPEYAGCKTWVHLDPAPPAGAAESARPVLSDERFAAVAARVDAALGSAGSASGRPAE